MYNNYGDKNFFEYGLLIDSEHSDTVFDMLICRPYDDEEDLFQFARIQVDIEDSWIDWEKVKDVIGSKLETPIERAIAAYEYYGPEEFGADSYGVFYDWRHMTREQIKKELKHFLIAHDNLVID